VVAAAQRILKSAIACSRVAGYPRLELALGPMPPDCDSNLLNKVGWEYRQLEPTNHWQGITRLDIHASSKQSAHGDCFDDGCSCLNQRVGVSGRVFPEYAALHL
jgi:hypothetical protein